tara:strand:- start:12889 stop:14190 length:1302 start_codon:yes stop_codon:yes gene_type:complete
LIEPLLSSHYQKRKPSAIRQAQITFSKRADKDSVQVINLAIGNISLPMHPAMQKRMNSISDNESDFKNGIIQYTPTVGTTEARKAFLNILESEEINCDNLKVLIADGGSQAIELMMLGVCGPSSKKPLMLLDPSYTNYIEFGKRLSIPIVTLPRYLNESGEFSNIKIDDINNAIKRNDPGALVVIPADNPTGQFISQKDLNKIIKLCVKNNIWIVSDEAYRQLYYEGNGPSSIWNADEETISGVFGRRISIESASKLWNACGLRIGALITDNIELHQAAVSEYTANLSPNAIGQYIFGALAHEEHTSLQKWYEKQRNYYGKLMYSLRKSLIKELPGLIVSKPQSAMYMVIDFRNICHNSFNAKDFVHFCAGKGKVKLNGKFYTLMIAPMNEFYSNKLNQNKTQMRIAVVEPRNLLRKAPYILKNLYKSYLVKN